MSCGLGLWNWSLCSQLIAEVLENRDNLRIQGSLELRSRDANGCRVQRPPDGCSNQFLVHGSDTVDAPFLDGEQCSIADVPYGVPNVGASIAHFAGESGASIRKASPPSASQEGFISAHKGLGYRASSAGTASRRSKRDSGLALAHWARRPT